MPQAAGSPCSPGGLEPSPSSPGRPWSQAQPQGSSQAEWPGAPWHRIWAMGDQEAPISVQMGALSTLLTPSPQKVAIGPLCTNGKGSSLWKLPKDRQVGQPEPSSEELPSLSPVGTVGSP